MKRKRLPTISGLFLLLLLGFPWFVRPKGELQKALHRVDEVQAVSMAKEKVHEAITQLASGEISDPSSSTSDGANPHWHVEISSRRSKGMRVRGFPTTVRYLVDKRGQFLYYNPEKKRIDFNLGMPIYLITATGQVGNTLKTVFQPVVVEPDQIILISPVKLKGLSLILGEV